MVVAALLTGVGNGGQVVWAGSTETPSPWTWRQIGPGPIRFDDARSPLFGEGNGGVVFDIAIDPRGTRDEVIYLATNGGVWKSIDGGVTWQPKTDMMPSNSTGAIALDPNDPDTVYAGTGTLIDPLGINFRAVGIYKSTDGGDSWTVLGRTTFGWTPKSRCAATRDKSCGRGISRIVVLPGAANVVIAGTNNGLFRSTDGGTSWNPVTISGAPNPNITDLDVDTSLGTTVYASVAGVGILRSVDGGATFTRNLLLRPGGPAPGTFSSIAFAQSTAQRAVPNNRIMYASVASSARCASLSCPLLGVWRSIDFGRTWSQAGAVGLENCQAICAFDQSIGVDPVAPYVVHVGLIDYFISSNSAEFFAKQGGVGHVDEVAITLSPLTHRLAGASVTSVWVGNHGGVWAGIPGEPCIPILGCNYRWRSRNEGLANLGIVSADIGRGSATNNTYSYAGVWDHGLVSKRASDPGMDWHLGILPQDGGFVTVDPINPLRAYGSANSALYVTDSAGADGWTARTAGMPPFDGPPSGNPSDLTDTVWRMAVDGASRGASPPFTSQRVYALVERQVYRSIDAGVNFTPTNPIPFAGPSNFPRAIAISASDPNVVWLGMTDGTLRFACDALSADDEQLTEPCSTSPDTSPGLTWQEPTDSSGNVSQPALGTPRPVATLAINPANPSETVVGYGPDAAVTSTTQPVWLTTNGGTTWTNITGNLPALPVNSVVFDPSTSPASIIVANDNGVMYTTDSSAGATWLPLGTGLPTVYAMELAHDPSATPQLLRVGTYGRSVFEMTGPVTDLQAGLRHEPEPVLGGDLTYHLFITNAGLEPAFGVVGQLELDPVLEFVSGAGCSADPGSNLVTCRVASLDASPEHGEGVVIDVVAHLKTCPPDRTVTSHLSVGSLLLSDTDPANNNADDTATFICLLLDTFIVSAVDGDGIDVPYFGKTTSTSIKFTFTGSEETKSYECSLDQGDFTPCTSPATYEDLVSGDHTVEVRSVDANGSRDPTPATHVWSVV
jgi:photosystem II stability/assembly factor-like uncharacterized protein